MNRIKRNDKGNGWIIPEKFRAEIRTFRDRDYGGSDHSYNAAKNELARCRSVGRSPETRVRSNKKSLNIVGITYYKVRDGNQVKHRFAVCNPMTGKPKMVHIGNDNTYERNWDAKLAEAEELREKFQTEHKERNEHH